MTAPLATLMDLARRIAALTAPNFAMDLEIVRALAPDIIVMRRDADDAANVEHTYRAPTANVDDALFLLDRYFPEHFYDAGRGRVTEDEPLFGFAICEGPDTDIGLGESDINLPIAILIAVLDALVCRHADGRKPAATGAQGDHQKDQAAQCVATLRQLLQGVDTETVLMVLGAVAMLEIRDRYQEGRGRNEAAILFAGTLLENLLPATITVHLVEDGKGNGHGKH